MRGTVVSARTVTRWLDRAGLNRRRDTRPHRATQSGRQTDPGPLPGPHDPPGRQEGRTHPTRRRLEGPRARNPQSQSLQTRQRSQDWLHLPAHRHRRLLTSGPHRGPRRVRRPPPRSASSAVPGPSSPPTASPGSCGSLPTTERTTGPGPSPRPSPPWPHATRGSVPTPHGTTARSSATTASWQRSASTRVPTPHSSSAVTPSQCGTTTTTTIDPTPPATASHPPPESQHTSPTSRPHTPRLLGVLWTSRALLSAQEPTRTPSLLRRCVQPARFEAFHCDSIGARDRLITAHPWKCGLY